MRSGKWIAGAVAVCALAGGMVMAGTVVPSDLPVSGKKLAIKDNANTAKRKATYLSKDESFVVGAIDPTASGATLQFLGATQDSSIFQMPAAGWVASGTKFKYADKNAANGPVIKAQLKDKNVKASLKGAQLDYPLIGTGPQGTIGVRFTVGATVICSVFPGSQGTTKKDDPIKGVYTAVKAEAPGVCPSSPSGAFLD